MANIYVRELSSNPSVWIAWTDERGVYETACDEATARLRLAERHIDWRFIALSALMNSSFEGITAEERELIENTIRRIRSLDERLERR